MIFDIERLYEIYSTMGYVAIVLIVFLLVYALVLRSMYRRWANYVPGPVVMRREFEKKEVWITKYALTEGIIKKEEAIVHIDIQPSGDFISVPWENGLNGECGFHKGDWTSSEAEAVAQAEEMRHKKITSLLKQVAKLEKLKF